MFNPSISGPYAPLGGFAYEYRKSGGILVQECLDLLQNSAVDEFLGLAALFKLAFRNSQRVIASLDDIKSIRRAHLRANGLE